MNAPIAYEAILTAHEKSDLRHQSFRGCDLAGIDLRGADLRAARFDHVCLERCDLTGADLRGAHFLACTLLDVVMTGVTLENNRFDGTVLCGVTGLTEEDWVAVVAAGGAVRPRHTSRR
jgi:uncharacterized protein YjbI with pentapeptide repeats